MTNLQLLNLCDLLNLETGNLLSTIEVIFCSDLESALDLCAHANSLPRLQEFNNLHLTDSLILARKALLGLAGINAIICQTTGAIYIGSSTNLGVRLKDHIIDSSNVHLSNAIGKHG